RTCLLRKIRVRSRRSRPTKVLSSPEIVQAVRTVRVARRRFGMWNLGTRRGRLGAIAVATTAIAALAIGAAVAAAGVKHRSDGKTIVFWHYLTDREQLLQQLADQYKKETGVTVQLTLLSPDIEAQKFQAGVQAN